jgi:hypothetical protein
MFGRNSRYYGLEIATLTVKDGQGTTDEIRYVRRRFVGRSTGVELLQHRVRVSDRLDNVTAMYLGDPTQFWRIADANRVLQPAELCDRVGSLITIPAPTV